MSIAARRLSRVIYKEPPEGPVESLVPPPPVTSYNKSILDFGAAADGSANDAAALTNAISDVASHGGGVVRIPNRQVSVTLSGGNGATITLPENVIIRGEGPQSEVLFRNNSTAFHTLFAIRSGCHLENLKMTRTSDLYGSMINFKNCKDVWIYNCVIDGQKDIYGTETFHGILISENSPSVIDGVTIASSTVRRCDFGLLQPSNATATFQNCLVESSLFEQNYATDLEFNAPNSIMRNITVKNSRFRNCYSYGTSSGWGIGLANVQTCEISECSFRNYIMHGIHIEDDSSQITIKDNDFAQLSTRTDLDYMSHLFIISGSNHVTVTGNRFDLSHQANSLKAIYIGAGGSYSAPHDVSVTDNTFILANNSSEIASWDINNLTVANNNSQSSTTRKPVATLASSEYPGETALLANDSNLNNTGWTAATNSYPQWWSVQFASPFAPVGYDIWPRPSFESRMPTQWKLQGSLDGTDWIDMDIQNNHSWPSGGKAQHFSIASPQALVYWRVIITASANADRTGIYEIRMSV